MSQIFFFNLLIASQYNRMNMEVISDPAALQGIPVLIAREFIQVQNKVGLDSQTGFACVWLLSVVAFILLWLKQVPTGNSCTLLAIPAFRSRTSCLASTGFVLKIPLSCSMPGSMRPLLPTVFFFVCSLPWWMLPRALPLWCGWCHWFRCVGRNICCPWVAGIQPQSWKSFAPTLWAILALSPFSHPLHSWQGTIVCFCHCCHCQIERKKD